MIEVAVTADAIDVAGALGRLESLGGGGIASFVGLVRGDGGLVELLLEHHPGMTAPALEGIAAKAVARFSLDGLILLHRHGAMAPGERIVFVGTAARHRAAALEACAFTIDWLKTAAPFWKRERFTDGASRWVEQRGADLDAADRWR